MCGGRKGWCAVVCVCVLTDTAHPKTKNKRQIWSPADSIYNEEEEDDEAVGSGAGPRDEDLEA